MEIAQERRAEPRSLVRRLRVGPLLALVLTGPLLVLLASVVLGALAAVHQEDVRHQLLGEVLPAREDAQSLESAVLNQETGIRGYELTGQQSFLEPYTVGLAEEQAAAKRLVRRRIPGIERPLYVVLAHVADWQQKTAAPAIAQARAAGATVSAGRGVAAVDADQAGKQRFDAIRTAVAQLDTILSHRLAAARAQLDRSARTTEVTLIVIAVVLLVSVLGSAVALGHLVSRPIRRLAAGSRRVAAGELSRSLRVRGPADIDQLAEDVDEMRRRLVAELDAITAARNELALTAAELERSNRDLEQFAYVASHDLQEPLRKVTSFVQLLQQRYGGQLDEKADQYIEFAVDGAVRMQRLINDLLAFSRVGRRGAAPASTDLTRLARAAASDLEDTVRNASAQVVIEPLPTLQVEASLIRTVFQNLIANSIKFCGEQPPRVVIAAERDGAEWRFSCTDNGIGIEPQYAERVFVIFQRLHPRERYSGTGIGLAMCRKIIEYHGGRVWLDTEHRGGTRIEFTLPNSPGSLT